MLAPSGWSVDVEKCGMAHVVHTVSFEYIYVLLALFRPIHPIRMLMRIPRRQLITSFPLAGNRSRTSVTYEPWRAPAVW